jgi:hypothetical protein
MKYFKLPPWQTFPIIASAGAFIFLTSVSPEAVAGEPHGLTLPISAPTAVTLGTTSSTTASTVSIVGGVAYDQPVILHQVHGAEFWLYEAKTAAFLERPAYYFKPPDKSKLWTTITGHAGSLEARR